ncbi:MAG: sulfatase-like hydrolase/transferase [Phycisphaerales bacterium]|nr:sulfatase-like hydrolase/transferase [Phycisphaerales bacterium]
MKYAVTFLIMVVVAGVVTAFGLRAGVRLSEAHQDLRPLPPLPRITDAPPLPAQTHSNVVIICIDTLRADHLSLYGYERTTSPNIDAFARDARVFDRAYSTTPFTTPSVMSMLTGLNPYRHGVRVLWKPLDDRVVTVADWLRGAGYQTAAIVSNLVLCDDASGLARRFDHYDAEVDEPEPNRPKMFERRAERTTDTALQWLSSHRDPQKPFFLWVHYIDPHGPYRVHDDVADPFTHEGRAPVDAKRVADYVADPNVTDMLDYVDRYDEEIRYADREVGRLLDALGKLDDTAIIITADHGEYLLERDDFAFCHGYGVDDAVTHIPLIVRHTSLPAAREATPVSLADVAPTVLSLAGFEAPPGLDGCSLTGVISDRPPYIEGPDPSGSGGRERAFVISQRKIVVRHGLSNIPRDHWAFDLTRDPREAHRLHVDAHDTSVVLLSDLIAHDAQAMVARGDDANGAPRNDLVADDLDEHALESLRGLGYVK